MMQVASRPFPPDTMPASFFPAAGLADWVKATFIAEGSPLHNLDHEHLLDAHIGYLWTTAPNEKGMRAVVGQAELPSFQGGRWQRGRQEQQVLEWFGDMPDFIITLDALYCEKASDVEFCALVEHELYHCAQAPDLFGMPKFCKDGRPKFAIRGHDVEEFVGVVRRYGMGDPDSSVNRMVRAAITGPTIEAADISKACGTCRLIA